MRVTTITLAKDTQIQIRIVKQNGDLDYALSLTYDEAQDVYEQLADLLGTLTSWIGV